MTKDAKYAEFLRRKAHIAPMTGIENPPVCNVALFPFQRDIVRWALRRGRAAIFAGTGLGKTLMALEWARIVAEHTGKPVLILTPLAVAAQFEREGSKFGIVASHVRQQSEGAGDVIVTNYEKLAHFDVSAFGGVVLDESSILKSFDGKTRSMLIEQFRETPFRLAATATPAPNDFMELGNHAEFLGIMSYAEMLATFFVHDSGETQVWRLKGHAESEFWRWMASWAVMLNKPSDLGYEDAGYDLPPLELNQHTVAVEYKPQAGMLFPMQAATLQERIGARRESVEDRVKAAAALVNNTDRPWIVWCNLNSESDALVRAIDGAVEVRGSDSENEKETTLKYFADGRIRVLVTKPSIAGFGLNWQHCADIVFVGLNDSWEQVYQAIRRCWRFGQTKPVNAHFIASELEGAVIANIMRKDAQAQRMAAEMVRHTADLTRAAVHGAARETTEYQPKIDMRVPKWLKSA